MTRRLLATAGGGGPSEPTGPLPPDPTLTQPRHVTQLTGLSQNARQDTEATTWRTTYRAHDDFTTLVIAYGATGQGDLLEPAVGSVALEKPDGTLVPVTWDGDDYLSLAQGTVVESDPIAVTINEGQMFALRMLVPANARWTVGGPVLPTTHMAGDHRAGSWVPASQPGGDYPATPTPLAMIGLSRPAVVCPAMIGDSICAMGTAENGWWRKALTDAGLTGLSYGRNATRYTAIDGREGNTLRAATHVLSQYSVNDLGDLPSVATLWTNAVTFYNDVNDQHPDVGIWQTTTTPSVSTSDNTATLAGQTVSEQGPYRQAWIAFLRDGAPCHPATKAALAVGATGTVVRAGQTGHPLKGVVDVAASVEQGGSGAPTGKWRVDLGPLGGDGVHPSDLGQSVMAPVVTTWLATLT